MSKDFTLEELHYKIQHLKGLAEDTRVSAHHRKMYQQGMAEFQRQFDELKAKQEPPKQAPNLPQDQRGHQPAPTHAQPPERTAPAQQAAQTAKPAEKEAEGVKAAPPPVKAIHVGSPGLADLPCIQIEREGGTVAMVNVKQLEGLLVGKIRDIPKLDHFKRELYHLLPTWGTFRDAVAYYKALGKAYQREPELLRDLKIDGRADNLKLAWSLVVKHANAKTESK